MANATIFLIVTHFESIRFTCKGMLKILGNCDKVVPFKLNFLRSLFLQLLKQKNLTRWIVFLPALAILITFGITLLITINAERSAYEKAIDSTRKEYINHSKAQAKERIDKLVDYVNINEKFLVSESKEEIKNIVKFAHKIIFDTYMENPKLPREVILGKIKTKLRDMRFFEDLSGYYFIYDLSGINVMHGANPHLEGQNLINLQDADGKYTIQEALHALEKEDGTFYTWRWKNPEDEQFRTKLGYIKLFKPLNIYFGSARYEDEIREKIKKETQKLLLNTRYGELGYIFAHDYKGNCISHADLTQVGKNRWDVQTEGQYVIRDFIRGAKISPEGFFISYTSTYRSDAVEDRRKVSYLRAIPQFGWVIGTGAYLEEENKVLKEQEEILRQKMHDTLSQMIVTSLIVILLVMWGMYLISKRIRETISRYENHLLLNNKQIREQKVVFETLYQKSADGIWLLKDGVFVDCNEAIVKMFKAKTKEELINISPEDISPEFQFDGIDSVTKSQQMNALALEKGVHKFEWNAKACDGTLFWISVVLTTIHLSNSIIQHASVRDITLRKELEEENKKQKKQLMHQVEHDVLTGLPNRNLLQDRLAQAIKKTSRDGGVLGVVFVDIDKFKSINDTLGHDAGDVLLKTIASRMQGSIRETDTVARLSGDEFIVLLDGCKDISDIFVAIKKLVSAFQAPLNLANESFKVTMSMGVSVYPHDGESATQLLKNADIAMYKAKLEGRNRYKFFDQAMNQETNEHLEVEKSLYRALANEELELYYQPQINLQTEKIVGVEALIRWNHPTKGLMSPGYFIHIAEESELIIEIGNWVTKAAMNQIKHWQEAGLNPGKMAINFAGKQLESPKLISTFITLLKETACKASWVEIEIVERFIMKDTAKSIMLLKRLRELGVDISIDDFGTGHSSLAYLKQLPITKLKIDQSFVQNLEESKKDRAIARTIIELGRGLGLKVLAEGVESEAQKEFIYENGCELMQGFLFSKPLNAEQMENLLKNQNLML